MKKTVFSDNHNDPNRQYANLLNAIEQISNTVMIVGKDDKIEYVNCAFEKITGYKKIDVVGKSPRILKSGKHEKDFYENMWKTILSGKTFHGILIDKNSEGKPFYLEQTINSVKDIDGNIVCFISTGTDITDNVRMEDALQESNEKLIVWVNELEERNKEILILSEMGDLLQTCIKVDEAYSVIVQSIQKLFPNYSGTLCLINESRNNVDVTAKWGNPSTDRIVFAPNECWALRRGHIHIVDDPKSGPICMHLNLVLDGNYMCVPMMAQGEAMGILHLQSNSPEASHSHEVGKLIFESKQRLAMTVAEHVSLSLANIKLRETLRIQAIRDALTGLFNRRYMEETLEREMHQARRSKKDIGIIMIDLDFFKNFNDTFGHTAGDAMLRQLGIFLKSNMRGGDIACRYGGEEFTLILPDANLKNTAIRAEQIRENAKHIDVQHRGQLLGNITLSIGVAVFPEHGSTVDEVLGKADSALYQAKAQGRDRVVTWQE